MATVQQAFALAFQHHQAGRLAEAEVLYRQILTVQPGHGDALQYLGVIAHQIGRQDLAVELIRQALALSPDNPAAHSNLGEAYRALGRLDDAIASYRRALELQPNHPEACNNLGVALGQQGRLDEAMAAYRRAIELKPDYADAYNNLGNILRDQGEVDEAIAAYWRAIQVNPQYPAPFDNLLCTLHLQPGCDRPAIAREHHRWNQQFGAPLKHLILPHTNDREPERRLRIGYVSRDFRDHVVGRNLVPLFQCHDSRNFEIVCYSGVVGADRLTDEFRQRAHQWRDTAGIAAQALAEMIRRDGVDILVDLSQHTPGNRLLAFAHQPAPVQVSFAGYPESTGLDAIEYRISDRWLESGVGLEIGDRSSEIGWKREPDLRSPISDLRSERVFLVDSFWCYDPCGLEVEVNPLPASENGRITVGSLNNFCKINEPLLKLWARILGQLPGSQLVLLSHAGRHRQRLLDVLNRGGIEERRIEFVEWLPRRAHLEVYRRLDIALDPFPYNGHTTSLDALWMGVPVISLAGECPVSRAGLSQLSNLGLPELVAHSEDEYESIATLLARDLPRLAELRRTLRPRMEASVLMDAPRFARNIEAAYRAMWRRWCAEKTDA